MLAFELDHNGRRIARAGLRKGVLSAMLTWVSRDGTVPPDRLASGDVVGGLGCRLGGLDTARARRQEHVDWKAPGELRLGDVITLRVTRSSRPDKPMRREASHVEMGTKRGVAVARCSFCGRDRPRQRASGAPGLVVGATVVICVHCLGAALLALESATPRPLHFARASGACSFCSRPRRRRTLRANGSSTCDACVKAARPTPR